MKVKKHPKRRWASMEDRPREKLTYNGPSSLTDVELVAVLLGTGTATEHVMDIAQKILNVTENSLGKLAALSLKDLMEMDGIGKGKAARLTAALEFARRVQSQEAPKALKIASSNDAFKVLVVDLGALPHEEFWILLLNRGLRVIRKKMISRGGLTSTVADPRAIFTIALRDHATSIIVAHNHPSGNLTPSQADIDLTKKLVSAGKLLDIQLVDHLIISGNNYCSFADSGLL